ncbi:transglycosylase SLT domain-containing protein [Rhizobium leguminosarum]|uniref:lytic transglycosylase domain-containing protein n=1 Tax=Rhizobium leguminosarum TaxID=384 RepID=UPI001C9749F1|nr:transglycosylase SLT domain-containing protein [Rhizobium leguminosarum]MBY5775223.1 transglycosylase SLT domain-containing protein [Rhizobium leguminosarum]
MDSLQEVNRKNYRKFIPAVCASATTALVAGQVQIVQAGVFEQTCSGNIVVMGSDAQRNASLPGEASTVYAESGMPSSIISDSLPLTYGTGVQLDAASAEETSQSSFSCADEPLDYASNTRAYERLKRLQSTLTLPRPNPMSYRLSKQQKYMREKAADVALRFAKAPGVRKAKLDTPVFITLFTTLVHRESNFEARAVSPVGARGLGQLMPKTARSLGVRDSFAPEQNLTGSATYLTEMLDQFGSTELALAAYNAGPGAVKKYRGVPPYRETRQYIADILHEVLREPRPAYVMARTRHTTRLADGAQLVTAIMPRNTLESRADGPFGHVLNPSFASKGIKAPHLGQARIADAGLVNEVALADTETLRPVSPLPRDLAALPTPRQFAGPLSARQLAIRNLAVDVGLRYSGSPLVERAGLSKESFTALFVALIRWESSFNPQAKSTDGAKGPGQLRPAANRELELEDPFSEEETVEASAKHFTRLLGEFGSPMLALAAYSAGPELVRRGSAFQSTHKTRQFVADVMHEFKKSPAPDFIVTRTFEREQWLIALPDRVPKDDELDALNKTAPDKDASPDPVKGGLMNKPLLPTPVIPSEDASHKLVLRNLL